jgi:hypothetical protein
LFFYNSSKKSYADTFQNNILVLSWRQLEKHEDVKGDNKNYMSETRDGGNADFRWSWMKT